MVSLVCKQGNLHILKKGNIQFWLVECLPKINLFRHLIHRRIKCHFFITTIKLIRRNKMIAMIFRTFNIKVLVFTLSNLLSEVDTQQPNISYKHINIKFCPLQQILTELYKYYLRFLLTILFDFKNSITLHNRVFILIIFFFHLDSFHLF